MKDALRKFTLEFKQFAMRGNVVDLAVGVVVGGAFSKIVTSLVNDLVTPLIGLIVGNASLTGFEFGPFNVGDLVNVILDFLITAFVVFLFVKLINRFRRKEAVVPTAPPTKEELLLTEIRDILKGQKSQG